MWKHKIFDKQEYKPIIKYRDAKILVYLEIHNKVYWI